MDSYDQQARRLLQNLVKDQDNGDGIGSFSPSVYDTAWVAMLEKENDSGGKHLAFPECLKYLMDSQQSDGGWESYSSELDGVLNTAAALLALQKQTSKYATIDIDLYNRCVKAQNALQRMLDSLDTSANDRVGFEIILPTLLDLLEQHSLHFDFRDQSRLLALRDKKLSKLFHTIYGKEQSTLLHSLEAFSGRLEYDKVAHHLSEYGAMMASPSSTASYLMHASSWDCGAESYIRRVLAVQLKKGHAGGVPSAFPATVFESSWVLLTLLEAGYSSSELGLDNLNKLANTLEGLLAENDGLTGFAASCFPDADDTAVAISVLTVLGKNPDVSSMISHFGVETHFSTYPGERNPSFSANCNVCLCLLRQDNVFSITAEIIKAIKFVVSCWYGDKFKDKWNSSGYYSMMLVAKTLVAFLSTWESRKLDDSKMSNFWVEEKIIVILVDLAARIMDEQQLDGSWDGKHEVTSYAMLALSSLTKIPWPASIAEELASRVVRGKTYLSTRKKDWANGDHLWIEKVAYSSSNLSLAYCLAAMKAPVCGVQSHLGGRVAQLFNIPHDRLRKAKTLLQPLDALKNTPGYKFDLWLLQSSRFVLSLRSRRLDVFTRKNMGSDKYLELIPFTWICFSNCRNGLSLEVQWDMMMISMLIYQVDEFMEGVIGVEFADRLEDVKSLIRRLCRNNFSAERADNPKGIWKPEPVPKKQKVDALLTTSFSPVEDHNGRPRKDSASPVERNSTVHHINGTAGTGKWSAAYESDTDRVRNDCQANKNSFLHVQDILQAFLTQITSNPKVRSSPAFLKMWLANELESFLLSHILQSEDSKSISPESGRNTSTTNNARSSYYDWVRTTSSSSTSCPFAFVYLLCLTEVRGIGTLEDALPRYVAQAAIRHLAIICRQHNDFGSATRDRVEGNLNSIDFSEFYASGPDSPLWTAEKHETHQKQKLLGIADYERKCMEGSLSALDELIDQDLASVIRIFVNVTDLYGQIYVARDMSPYKLTGTTH